jgi:hypothetical protein
MDLALLPLGMCAHAGICPPCRGCADQPPSLATGADQPSPGDAGAAGGRPTERGESARYGECLCAGGPRQRAPYEARFRVKQVEDHIRYLNLALQLPSCATAGCQAALQSRIQIAQGERTTLLTIRQPRNLFGLNGTLMPRGATTGGGTHAPRGPGGPTSACTAPQITGTFAPAGQPGTPVTISGDSGRRRWFL